LLCLDAYTGWLIWEREGVEVMHLLGVARGRLIATFGGPVRGIRGLNLRTGADSGPTGWTIHDDGGAATFGRGLVTEEAIVWPTRDGLYFLDPADGTQLRSPIPGPFGNLCYADGVLLVTTATEVWGYVSEAKKLADRRKAVNDDPENPAKHADLAQSLIDAGLSAEAEAAALKSGDAKDRLRWLLAEKMIRDGDRAGAKRLYGELAKGDESFAAAATVRLAEMNTDPAKVREAWRAVFSKRATIRDEHGVPWPARTYAETKSPDLLTMRGTGVREDDFVLGPDSPTKAPVPLPGYVRTSVKSIEDPSLRVLHESERGIIAAGERLHDFPEGKGVPLASSPHLASFDSGGLTTAGPDRFTWFLSAEGRVRAEIAYEPSGPKIGRVGRPALPSASGKDGPRELTGIRLDGEQVAFVYDERFLATFHPLDGYGRVQTSPAYPVRIHPNYSRWCKLVQTADGRMLVWDNSDRPPREFPCTRKPWSQPPEDVGEHRFLIPDDGAVLLFDARAGKELARYTLPGPESLTGELPRFRVHQGDVLLLIDRNHGVEVDRLRIVNLQRVWSRGPVFVGRALDDLAFAADRFFTAADGILAAYSWKDGQQLWEAPLPDVPHPKWKLAVAPQGVLAYPAEAVLRQPGFDAVGEFRRAGWDRAALLRAASRTYDVWADRELRVLVIDPNDGRLVQRLTFPAAGPVAGVAVTPKGVVVVTGKGSWTLAAR
jgi:hypothetical protein